METASAQAAQPAQSLPPQRRAPILWQPAQPVFWVTAALILVFGVSMAVEVASGVSAPSALLAAVLLGAVQAVLLWLIVRAMPRFRRQPRSLRIVAVVWGATVVPGVAIIANSAYGDSLWSFGLKSLTAALTAPVNEDAMRLLGVLVVLSLAGVRRITVMDGAVYGFLVGAGFEVLENLLYALRGEDLLGTLSTGVARLVVGFGLHALWTTAAGAGLAYCLSRKQQGVGGRWWVLILMMLAPMLLHAAWDAPGISVLPGVRYLVFGLIYLVTLALFFGAVAWGRRSEYAWYVETGGSAPSRAEFRRLPRAERRSLAAEAVAGADG
jgi:RsiW-degrading membrane proteinase PrsW (M82 family)